MCRDHLIICLLSISLGAAPSLSVAQDAAPADDAAKAAAPAADAPPKAADDAAQDKPADKDAPKTDAPKADAPAPAVNQPVPVPVKTAPAANDDSRNIRFQFDGIPYNDVIRSFAQMAGKPILGDYDVQGTLTFFDAQPYTYDEALDTLNIILAMQGHMVVADGRFFRVAALADTSQLPVKILEGLDKLNELPPSDLVTVVLPVAYLDAESAAKALVPMVTIVGKIAPLTRGKGVLLTDRASNVKRIRSLLSLMDRNPDEETDLQMKSYQLKHGSAEAVANIINVVVRATASGGGGGEGDRRTSRSGKPSTIVATADQRTNFVLVRGTPDLLPLADQIVEMLDSEGTGESIRAFGLKTAGAKDVAAAIGTMYGSGGSSSSRSGGRVSAYGDSTMNSVIVRANAVDMTAVEKLILELDKSVTTFNSLQAFRLKSTSAEAIANVLRAVLAPRDATGERVSRTVNVTADPTTNTIYVSGSPSVIETAAKAIADIDRDIISEGREIHIVALKDADAPTLAASLSQMYEQQLGKALPGVMPVIQGITASNSLLVSSSAEQWTTISKLIEQIKDATVPTDAPVTRIVPLKNAKAVDVAETLRAVYDRSGAQSQVTTPSSGSSEGSSSSRERSRSRNSAVIIGDAGKTIITIAPSEHNNSLVIVASEKDQEKIAETIKLIDVEADAAVDPIQIVRIKSASAESLAKTLKAMIPKPDKGATSAVFVEADKATNAVLIRGPESQRKMIEQMIATLDGDTKAAARELRMIQLKHVSASAVVPMLQQLFSPSDKKAKLEGEDARYYYYYLARLQSEGKPIPEDQMGIDPTANVVIAAAPGDRLVIVDGPRSTIDQIARIIETLDREDGPAQQQVRTYTLSRSNSREIAESLSRLFGPDKKTDQGASNAAEPAPRFEADTASNQLLVSATPAQYEAIEKIIKDIEKGTLNVTQTKTYRLKFASAAEVVPVLQAMLTSSFNSRSPATGSGLSGSGSSAGQADVRVAAMAATNDVVIQGAPDKLALAEQLIKTFDTQDAVAGSVMQAVFLKNAQAVSLAEAVTAVIAAKAQRSATGDTVEASVIIAAEPNSNSVLVRGSPAQVEAVVEMITRLDTQSDSGITQMRIFKLDQGDAESLSKSLGKLFEDIIKQQATQRKGVTPPPFSIAADARTNSLVVSTTPAYFTLFEQLLKQIDQEQQHTDRDVAYFALKNADAFDVAGQIDTMYTDRKGDDKPVVQADLYANAITVVAKDADMATIESVIQKIDKAAEDNSIQVRVVPAKALKAAKLAEMLKTIYEQTSDTDVIVTDRIPKPGDVVKPLTPDQPKNDPSPQDQPKKGSPADTGAPGAAGPGAQLAAAKPAEKPPQVIIAVDEGSNSVLISGTRAQLDEIELLITKLSGSTTSPELDVRVFPVRHTDPDVIVRVINGLFNPRATQQLQANDPQAMQQMLLMQQQQLLNQQLQRGGRGGDEEDPGRGGDTGFLRRGGGNTGGNANNQRGGSTGNQRNTRGQQQQDIGPTVAAVADKRSNKVIVRGNTADLDLIGQLIQQLDQSSLAASEVRVFTLKNTDARQVADNLREIITGELGSSRKSTAGQHGVLIRRELAEQLQQLKDGEQADPVDMANVVSIAANAQTNSVIVAAPGDAMSVIARIVQEIDQSAALAATPSVRLYPVKHPDLAGMVANLNRIFEPIVQGDLRGGQNRVVITSDTASAAIIVSAFPDQHEMIAQVIKDIDTAQPGEALTIKVYPVEHADAATVAQTLSETLIPGGRPTSVNANTLRWLRGPGGGNAPRAPTDPTTSTAANYVPLRITADTSSNTLVVRATKEEHEQIAALLQQIDIAPASTQPVQLIALQHADPRNVAQVLTRVLVAQDQSPQGRFLRGSAQRESIVIEGDPDSRMLMVRADEKMFARIKELAMQLDVASPTGQLVRKIIKLKHAQAASVAAALTTAFDTPGTRATGGGARGAAAVLNGGASTREADENNIVTVVAEPVSNSVIVTASEPNHEKVEALIAQIDTEEQSGVVTQFVILKNAKAVELANALQRVASNTGGVGVALGAGQRGAGAGRSFTGQPQTVVSADSTSNAVILSGPATDVDRLKQMAMQLDVAALDVETGAYIIPVKNGDAVQLAQIVKDLYFQSLLGGGGASSKSLAVSADPRSNSLVVVCDQQMLIQLRFLAAQLDFMAPKRGTVRVITLQHADPAELQRAIQQIYGGTANVAPSNQPQQGGQFQQAPPQNPGPGGAPGNFQQAPPNRGNGGGRNNQGNGGGGRNNPNGGGRNLPIIPGAPGPIGSQGVAGLSAAMVAAEPQGQVSTTVLPQQRAILIGANDEDFEAIQKLAEAMEAAAAGNQRKTKVVILKNAQNDKVAQALNQMYQVTARTGVEADRVTVTALTGTDAIVIAAVETKLPDVEALVQQLDSKELSPQLEFRIYALKNSTPSKIVTLVRQMLDRVAQVRGNDTIDVQADDRTRSLIVTARGTMFDQIGKVIETLDREPMQADAQVLIIQLKRADATRLALVLNEALKPAAEGQVTPEARALQEQVRKLNVKLGDGDAVAQLDLTKPIRILADPVQNDQQGSNALVVTSTPENLKAIEALVTLMDRVPLTEELRVLVVPLDFADAGLIAQTLTEIFTQGREKLAGTPGTSTEGKAEPKEATGRALVNPLNVSTDVRTNTLIISGRDETLALAQQVIKQLDREQPIELREIGVIALKNAEAATLAPTLQTMMDARVQRQQSLGVKDAERFRVIIAADARSNMLLVGGSKDGFELTQSVAKQLDEAAPALAGQVQLFPLEHANAGTLSVTLQTLFDQRYAAARTADVQKQKPVILPDLRVNALLVAANADDSKVLTGLLKKMDVELKDPSVLIEVLGLKHNDAGIVGPSIQRLFQARLQSNTPPGQTPAPQDQVSVEYDALSNALIISASKENLGLIKDLLAKVDVEPPAETSVVRMYPLKNADAQRVGTLLKSLIDQGLYKPGSAAAQDNALIQAREKIAVEIDTRTNVLIVSASKENFTVIEQIIEKLDSGDDFGALADVRLYILKQADATRLAPTLQQFFDAKRAAEQQVGGGAAARALAVSIIPDARTNTLLVAGSRESFAAVEAMIQKLDGGQITPGNEFRVFGLKNATAAAIQPTIQQLFAQRAARGDVKDTVTVVADGRANALIVGATSQDMQMVEALIQQLDVVPKDAGSSVRIFPLKKADANQVAVTLRNLYASQALGAPATGQTGGTQAAAGGVTISVDERVNALVVSAGKADLARIEELIKQLDTETLTRVTELRVFTLEHADAQQLSDLLTSLLTNPLPAVGATQSTARQTLLQLVSEDEKGNQLVSRALQEGVLITPDRRTNSVVVSAPLDYMPLLSRLIKELDLTSPRAAQIRVFQLKNADAQQMADVLTSVFRMSAQTTANANDERAVRYTLITPLGDGTAATVGTDEKYALTITVDPRTNSLLVGGTMQYVGLCSQMIEELDASPAQERTTRVYRLRHGQAADIQTALGAFLDQERQRLTQALGNDKLGAAQRLLEREVAIVAEPTSNALLVSASPRYFSTIEAMINELDSPKPQVLIQAVLAEVQLDEGLDLGIEWQVNKGIGGANVTAGTDFGIQQAFNMFGGMGVGVTTADISVFIRALQTQGKVELISRPQILASDNQPAMINIGQRVPFVTNSRITDTGGTVNTVEYQDVGIMIEVTARLNDDGFVTMDIHPEVSSIADTSVQISESVNAIVVNTRSANTRVSVQDGQTIVIGGLITANDNTRVSKVPLLGDIPVLGHLFKSTSRDRDRRELLIILTPTVIRTAAEADAISRKQRERLEMMKSYGDNLRDKPLPDKSFELRLDDIYPKGEGPLAPAIEDKQQGKAGSKADNKSGKTRVVDIRVDDQAKSTKPPADDGDAAKPPDGESKARDPDMPQVEVVKP